MVSESSDDAFFSDSAIDRLTAALLKLAAEVWVLSERLAALEAREARRTDARSESLTDFRFTPEEDATLQEARAIYVRRIVGSLTDPS